MKKFNLLIFVLLFFPTIVFAADLSIEALQISTNIDGGKTYSLSIQILLIMTLLTLLPAIVLMMTSFTRIVIVLSILRQALGMPQTPSNQILIGLSLFLSAFIMMPIFTQAYDNGILPYNNDEISAEVARDKVLEPIKEFMFSQTREEDLSLFTELSESDYADTADAIPITVLIPAFVTSELKTAFQIGFVIFIPFLVIDLVVASVLMAMGMMMLSPLIISLPFKIMLFVLVDGWNLIMGTLAASFILG